MIKRRHILLLDGLALLLVLIGRALTGWMIEKEITPCIYLQKGFLCPACGGTRCVDHLLKGDLLQAFQMNPYIFCTVFLCAGVVIFLNITAFTKKHRGEKLLQLVLKPRWLIVWSVGFAVFGILRNFV